MSGHLGKNLFLRVLLLNLLFDVHDKLDLIYLIKGTFSQALLYIDVNLIVIFILDHNTVSNILFPLKPCFLFILFLFERKHRCKWIQRCRRLRLRLFHIGHLDRRRLVGATLGYTALIGRHSRADFTANVSDSTAFIFKSIEVTSIML